MSKMIEYREAFVKSLRSYSRPVSAYSKYGGRQGVGLKRNISVTPGLNKSSCVNLSRDDVSILNEAEPATHSRQLAFTPTRQKRDPLVESQLTFNHAFFQ
jgi:hypothetical protein